MVICQRKQIKNLFCWGNLLIQLSIEIPYDYNVRCISFGHYSLILVVRYNHYSLDIQLKLMQYLGSKSIWAFMIPQMIRID